MKLAIITARGGSKRIPRKNIRHFCGKPILAYSIQAAFESGCFDEVMVSTDDPEIAETARRFDAQVPFMRSAAASSDHATTAEVLMEVLQEYHKRGRNPEVTCGIYPCAPFVTGKSLNAGLNLLTSSPDIHGVFPVTRFSYPIQRALRMRNGLVSMFQPEHLLTRSQDLERAYHDAGQFYWLKVAQFEKNPSLITDHTAGLELPEYEVQDIDNETDWRLAELKYRFLNS